MEERVRRTLKLIGGEDWAARTHNGGPDRSAGGGLSVAINGQPLSSVDDLHRFLAEWPSGEPEGLTIRRGLERRTCGLSRGRPELDNVEPPPSVVLSLHPDPLPPWGRGDKVLVGRAEVYRRLWVAMADPNQSIDVGRV